MNAKSKAIEEKKKAVVALAKELSGYKTVAVINLSGLPARQYQSITRKLKDKIKVKYAKKTVQTRAIDSIGKETVGKLKEHLNGIPVIVLTNSDAFSLAKLFRQNQSNTAAKPEQESPEDIWVKAGPTPFTPGPVISELAQLKIKAGVVGGKIEIKQDSLVVKKGEKFSQLAASMLARLGIKPMKVGIKLVAAAEANDFYLAEQLDIDDEKFISDLRAAVSESLILAVETGVVTDETIALLLAKAERETAALAAVVPNQTQENKEGG